MPVKIVRLIPITLFLISLLGVQPVIGSCGEGKPAKQLFVVSWNGDSNMDVFDDELKELQSKIAPHANHHYFFQGESSVKKAKKAWIPSGEESGKFSVQSATLDSLHQLPRLLRERMEELKKTQPDLSPEDFEVLFMVTNHGHQALNGPSKEFGIASNPWSSSGTLLAGEKKTVWASDLKKVFAEVPQGIRFKTLFTQCYGSDTQRDVLTSIPTRNECKCGASLAGEGFPVILAEFGKRSWGQDMIESLSRGKGLAEASWLALRNPDQRVFRTPDEKKAALNDGLSSSARWLDRVLQKQLGAGTKGIAEWDHFQMESNAATLLASAKSQGKTLSEADREWLQQSQKRKTEILSVFGVKESEARKDSPPPVREDRGTGPGDDSAPGDISNSAPNPAKRLIARFDLEELFFHLASDAQKKEYMALVSCESDPIVLPGVENPDGTNGNKHR